MNDPTPSEPGAARNALSLDEFLREVLPDVKLALGELIDRENARSLPERYARLLPETLLAVTLRPDVAEVLTPVARALEMELTDSCSRHGSLYDRTYRVQLRRSEHPAAPLFAVSSHAGQELAQEPAAEPAAEPAPAGAPGTGGTGEEGRTEAAPYTLPIADPDATRIEGTGAPEGWEPGRWILVVEDQEGEESEVVRLSEPLTTVGRRSDDPLLQTTVALRDVPHISRRQLALAWEPRDGAAGFRVFNLGLNVLHLPSLDLPGARVGRGPLRLDQVAAEHSGWIAPGMPLRIGERGPVLRIEEVEAQEEEDPDATQFG
jgi:hypothetical protein